VSPSYITNKINTKKLKPGLVASHDIRPGDGVGLFWFRRFINLSLTYSLSYNPGTHTRHVIPLMNMFIRQVNMCTEQYCHCPLAVATVCIASSIKMDKELRFVYIGCIALRCRRVPHRTATHPVRTNL